MDFLNGIAVGIPLGIFLSFYVIPAVVDGWNRTQRAIGTPSRRGG